MTLDNSSLHYQIIKSVVERSKAPTVVELSHMFAVSADEMVQALKALQEYHGVVLHPKSSEVWAIHPFSNAPTNFWLETGNRGWWSNCGWCSLGAAALLERDLTITTTLGGESKQAVIEIKGGELVQQDIFIHFPIPMVKAWENVTYTCSTMLMFSSGKEIDSWCERHGMEKGDVQCINTIWEFAKVWYGKHLNPDWKKWSIDEATEIFERFNLSHPVWEMPAGGDRF